MKRCRTKLWQWNSFLSLPFPPLFLLSLLSALSTKFNVSETMFKERSVGELMNNEPSVDRRMISKKN